MYDTVAATMEWDEPLNEGVFQGGQATHDLGGGSVLRLWHNGDVRLTYWRRVGRFDGGRIRAEFSIPRLAGGSPYSNPTQGETERALEGATEYSRTVLGAALPPVGEWRANRVDYAWNFEVGDQAGQYMALLQSLWIDGMVRHPFPDVQGVVWKSKQRGARWVKFYDKCKQVGDGMAAGVLRYEVSNYKRAIPYMCDGWFGCKRTVGEMLHPGRALYTMAVQWERLGLGNAAVYGGDENGLLLRLRQSFGAGAAGALFALKAISAYGAEAHREYGLMSSNTYYRWKRELRKHEYMLNEGAERLPALDLPYDRVFSGQKRAKNGQNLAIPTDDPAEEGGKNLRELLGVRPGARLPKYLVERWERYAAA